MRKFKAYILLTLVLGSFTSCLDKFPEDQIPADKAITTVSEADQAVIGIYSAFLNSALYSGNLTILPDLQCDFLYAVEGYSNRYGNIWRWDILGTNNEITAVYAALYDIIGRCNYLFEYLDDVEKNTYNNDDLDRIQQFYGEAYFARALAYSELIKLYCKAYENQAQAESELGVVLRSEYYTDKVAERSSLWESYQFVLEDLKQAELYLKLDDDFAAGSLFNSTYFNEYTVHALRARVALYMKDYEQAIKSATKVIESGQYLLSSASTEYAAGVSYFDYMWQTDNATEIIWKIGYTATNYGGALGTIFFNYDYVTMKPDYVPAQWVLNLYSSNDARLNSYFAQYQTGHTHGLSWPLLIKYWGNSDLFNQAQLLNMSMPKVFRLAEQYLIRAEAYASLETPNYTKAANDIATLRSYRYINFGGGVSMNKDNAMQIIEEERVKELYMEGFRLMDLKRWNKGFERKEQQNSLPEGSSLKIEKDNALFVWPIPNHELESPDANIQPNESNK